MPAFNLQALIRPHLKDLQPYASARDEYTGDTGIFLDANENALGSAIPGLFNRYPDPHQRALKARLAALKGVKPEQVFLGNGSDEAIDLLFRAFCRPGKDEVILLPPTYGMYKVSAEINEAIIREVALDDSYDLDLSGIKAAISPGSKLIFVCSPNNPTGNMMSRDRVEALLRDFPGIVVVDEAYVDFAPGQSLLSLLDSYVNLVVLQTFSKAWGMARLRLGMAFASAEILDALNRIKPPYNVNGLTQEKALEALDNVEHMQDMVGTILKEREHLKKRLLALPQVLNIYPSDANFLLVKTQDPDKIYQHLTENQVIVRNRSRVQKCEGCLRITVGTREENEVLISQFANVPMC